MNVVQATRGRYGNATIYTSMLICLAFTIAGRVLETLDSARQLDCQQGKRMLAP